MGDAVSVVEAIGQIETRYYIVHTYGANHIEGLMIRTSRPML
jgi:hypothetical protein